MTGAFLKIMGLCFLCALLRSSAAFAAMPALSADTCTRGGLELKLVLQTDNGLTNYEQRIDLALTGGPEFAGKVSRPLKEETINVRTAHCKAWLKKTGARLPQLFAIMKAPLSPAETKAECHKKGHVQIKAGSFVDSAAVCFSIDTKTRRSEAFRELYETIELFLSVP